MTALDLAKSRNLSNIVEMLSSEDFKTANSNFLKLNTFTGDAHKFKYTNMILFFVLHLICIYLGYFILCQSNLATMKVLFRLLITQNIKFPYK